VHSVTTGHASGISDQPGQLAISCLPLDGTGDFSVSEMCVSYIIVLLVVFSDSDLPWINSYEYLVGGLEHFLFFHILGMSSSQPTHIFQRG